MTDTARALTLREQMGLTDGPWPDGLDTVQALIELSAGDLRALATDTDVNPEVLTRLAALRRDAISALQAQRTTHRPWAEFADVVASIHDRTVSPVRGRWLVYQLDSSRLRMLDAHAEDPGNPDSPVRFHYRRQFFTRFPAADAVHAPPTGGALVVIYGAGPRIFAERDVQARAEQLLEAHPVADIVCAGWQERGVRRCHSLRYFAKHGATEEFGEFPWAPSGYFAPTIEDLKSGRRQ